MLKKFLPIVFASFMAVTVIGCAAEGDSATDADAATTTDTGAEEGGEEDGESEEG